ncbi:MAG: DUF1926 domain-containing protein, partial [Acidobacteria bacterium]|nr:DUF1926 domain-containing protein [Acidobacteriota bacterium]
LDRCLQYDAYNRHAFRSLVFGAGRSLEDYRLGRLAESSALAGGPFEVVTAEGERCALAGKDPSCLCEVWNEISIAGSSLTAEWRLKYAGLAEVRGGLELVLNLLAPDAHDRYFVLPGGAGRPRLAWAGEAKGDCLALVDEWGNLRIDVRVRPAAVWWILPIYTVSRSEGGFEKVYQGSAILPHWAAEGAELRALVKLSFGPAR